MEYTIRKNEQFESIEVIFDGKPCEAIRAALKALKFRWNGARALWYGYTDEQTTREAIEAAENGEPVKTSGTAAKAEAEQKKTKANEQARLFAAYAEQIEKVEKSESMRKYYLKEKKPFFVELSDGRVIMLDGKPKIETQFCFGESGYDYDDAQRMAAHARRSEEYFIRENMEPIEKELAALREHAASAWGESSSWGAFVYSARTPYNMPGTPFRTLEKIRVTDALEARGGSWEHNAEDLDPEQISREDCERLAEAYEQIKADFEKRLNAYLKRYGLSKIHAWTYWRDA